MDTERSEQVDLGLEDEKLMEADIDRMIAEMQNKPYDSSKYLETSNPPLNNENYNISNAAPIRPVGGSRSREKSGRKLSTERPPAPPRQPHTPPPARTAYPMHYTQQTLSPMRSSHSSSFMGSTQVTNLNRSASRHTVPHQAKSGIVRMKIHELMTQHPEQELPLLLKVFINEQG